MPQRKKPLIRETASILSPLRYPGAKRRLAGYLAQVLRLNKLRPKLFVEPFAGGASVALALLNDGLVEKIALGERDPLVAAFWKTVFRDPEWLVQEIQRIPVTIQKWRYFRTGKFRTDRDRALACLFLNRTSFSGILSDTAGPIGGYKQQSPYRIDCPLLRRLSLAAYGRRHAWHTRLNSCDWANGSRHSSTSIPSSTSHPRFLSISTLRSTNGLSGFTGTTSVRPTTRNSVK